MATKKKASKSPAKSKGAKSSIKKSLSSSGKKVKASKRVAKSIKKSSASSTKKPKRPASSKKTKGSSTSKPKKKPSTPKKVRNTQKVVRSKPSAKSKTSPPKNAKPQASKSTAANLSGLSSQERYNVGGLCACVIDVTTKDGMAKLQRALGHLQLSELEQANLIRVSQGLKIPKIFADGLKGEDPRRRALQVLTQFARADDQSSKGWKTELEDLGRLLGS